MIESVDALGAVVIVAQSGPFHVGADLTSHRVRLWGLRWCTRERNMRPLLERTFSTVGPHQRRKKNSESHSHLSLPPSCTMHSQMRSFHATQNGQVQEVSKAAGGHIDVSPGKVKCSLQVVSVNVGWP